jgi:cytidyltransferase-like protein
MTAKRKKVFVSGCFDMLHSGHVAFLTEASRFGDLTVGIGSDETVSGLKGRYPVNTQEERKFMLQALRCVHSVVINRGSGHIDFEEELRSLKPDAFVVNEDGNSPAKARLCRKLGIRYVVLRRIPHANLPRRSTTTLRRECTIPYRIDLAGGWLDQPYVGRFSPGPVLTIAIEPTVEFNERSGMASSTRRRAIELWQSDVPGGDREKLAKVLFSYENPPGKDEVAGSQDALGIVLPGLNRLEYDGGYWPRSITSHHDERTLAWLEHHLQLVTLGPRQDDFRVLRKTAITRAKARALARAAEGCWDAICARDLKAFGREFRKSFEAQVALFPLMVNREILALIDEYRDRALGWKLSGAGGGGYLILATDREIPGSMRIKIRRKGST